MNSQELLNKYEIKYGKYYFCAKVTSDLSKDGEIYAYADEIDISLDGSLQFIQVKNNMKYKNLVIAKGKWLAIFSASVIDGSAVSVEHGFNL